MKIKTLCRYLFDDLDEGAALLEPIAPQRVLRHAWTHQILREWVRHSQDLQIVSSASLWEYLSEIE